MDESKKPLVCIAYPSGDFVHVKFVSSLIGLISYTSRKNIDVAVANMVSSRITLNRNHLVEMARKFKASHILFIDSDMAVPTDGIERLLSYNEDIVCATASKREDEDRRPLGTPVNREEIETNKSIVEMEFIGLPFMLIKMEVFDALQKPYFAEPATESGDVEGEDVYFCTKVRNAGYKIFCDMKMSEFIGHIGIKVFTIDTGSQSSQLHIIPKIDEAA